MTGSQEYSECSPEVYSICFGLVSEATLQMAATFKCGYLLKLVDMKFQYCHLMDGLGMVSFLLTPLQAVKSRP